MQAIFKVPNALSYKGDSKNWQKFKQLFDIYMKVTGFIYNDSESKVNIFLNIAGEEAVEIYNNLNLDPTEKNDYDIVMEAFENYCVSKHNVIYKSFKFFTRVQQPGEFFTDFYNDLQVMAEFCNFGEQKDRLIRDRIIAGIKNPVLQEKFLKAPDLCLDEVVSECCNAEVRKMNAGHFKREIDCYVNPEGELVGQEEGNNNYEELLTQEVNTEGDFLLDRIHIPNEVLFNDIAEIEDGKYDNNKTNMDEETDEEEVELDIKPVNILKPIERAQGVESKENISGTSRSNNGRVLERRKKAEAIKMKVAEIKMRLRSDIKKEVDREQMGIRQKFTRSRKNVKNEPEEEQPEEEAEPPVEEEVAWMEEEDTPVEEEDTHVEEEDSHVEEQDSCVEGEDSRVEEEDSRLEEEDSHVEEEPSEKVDLSVEGEQVPYENKDPYAYEEESDCNESVNNYKSSVVQEYEGEYATTDEVEGINGSIDSEGVEDAVEMEVEYLVTQEPADTKSPPKKGQKRKKGARGPKKTQTVKIIKVKRDNLPTLILKSVKKKTLLLGKMPYPCKKCDSSFWTNVQLERHELVHILKKAPPPNNSTPKKIFKCEVCAKEFKKICDLERHTRVHTGEKPSVCNICNKRFQQAYNLNKHLLIHTQEKNFECVICQKKFGRNDVLNRHVLTHSIYKPFHCPICSKTFIRNTQLNLHLRKHHKMKEEWVAAQQEAADDPTAGKSSD